jgi:uncharacterized Rmd1/YagE family protein
MYHLPLLPGYGPNTSLRSSILPKSTTGKSILSRLSEAEENGYQGTYFTAAEDRSAASLQDGYITSSSPVQTRREPPPSPSPTHQYPAESETDVGGEPSPQERPEIPKRRSAGGNEKEQSGSDDDVAEVVFFDYGVVVFFGLAEVQERGILDDVDRAGVLKRKIKEADWEVEECHFAVRFHGLPIVSVVESATE